MKTNYLPRRVKIGYGVAEFGLLAVEMLLRLYLLMFYTDVVGLRADLAGYAVGLAIFWDAITDPLMGSISDRTHSRWGKRRPFILVGGFALAAATFLLFSPPALSTQAGKFFFLMASYILLNTCLTIIAVPHIALGGELTFDRDERTELFGWRFLFTNLGAVFGTVIPGYLLSALSKHSTPTLLASAYSMSSLWIGVAIILCAGITVYATRGGLDQPGKSGEAVRIQDLLHSWKTVLQNRLFATLVSSYIVATIGLSVNGVIALYYYRYRLKLPMEKIQYVLVVFLLVISFSIPGWIWASQKFNKKWPAFWGVMLLGVFISIGYPILPPNELFWPMVIAIVGGVLTGSVVMLDALVADIVDYDELETGEHREGLYFGFWKMAAKAARALAVAGTGVILQRIGFVPNQEQSPDVMWNLGLLFGPGVGVFFVFGALIFAMIPYSDEEHKQVQQQLLERKSAARP